MNILYLSACFPLLSETFIAYEIADMRRHGADVRMISLSAPESGAISHLPDILGYQDAVITLTQQTRLDQFQQLLKIVAYAVIRRQYRHALRFACDISPDVRLSRMRKLQLAHTLITYIRQWQPDIIHCHFGPTGNIGAQLIAHKLIEAPLSCIFHGYDVSKYLHQHRISYALIYRQAALLLTVSDYYRTRLMEHGAPEALCHTHHMGVDCEALRFQPRQIGKITECICVGRFTEKKGHETLLRAYALLTTHDNIHLHLVGNGPHYAPMQALAASLDLTDHLTFHGAMQHDQVQLLLDRCHLFLLPSVTASDGDQEGIPVALMEAMALGLPVISTYHSGIPELIEDGVNGMLVDERDETALARAWQIMLDHPQKRSDMAVNARTTIEQHFNRAQQAARLYTHFSTLCATRS